MGPMLEFHKWHVISDWAEMLSHGSQDAVGDREKDIKVMPSLGLMTEECYFF